MKSKTATAFTLRNPVLKNKNKRIETNMSSLKSHASYLNTFKTDFRYFNTDAIHLNVLLVLKPESMSYTLQYKCFRFVSK